jgi:hypothetical protein
MTASLACVPIGSVHVAAYVGQLQKAGSAPTAELRLADSFPRTGLAHQIPC